MPLILAPGKQVDPYKVIQVYKDPGHPGLHGKILLF